MNQNSQSSGAGACPASLGNFNPLVPVHALDPHPMLAQARREQPVFFSDVLQMWVVTRYEDVRAILKDNARFSSRENAQVPPPVTPEVRERLDACHFERAMVNSDPPVHTHWRAVFNELLEPAFIASQAPRIRALAEEMLDEVLPLGRADMIARFAYPFPLKVILMMMDIPFERMPLIKAQSDQIIRLVSGAVPPEEQMAALQQVIDYQSYIEELFLERRESPGADLISALGKADLSPIDPPTRATASLLSGVIVAAHETTTCLLANSLRMLLSSPERWQAAVDDPSKIPGFVEEALRLEAPFKGMRRLVMEDSVIGGVRVPAGARLFLSCESANRDDQQFAEPDALDCRRENSSRHLSFGHGIHYCVGAALARLEGRVSLEILTRRLQRPRLAADRPLTFIPSLLHVNSELWVEWDGDYSPRGSRTDAGSQS